MLGKLIVYGRTRDEALRRMRQALSRFRIEGIESTIPFLEHVMADPDFAAGRVNTGLVERLIRTFEPAARPATSATV